MTIIDVAKVSNPWDRPTLESNHQPKHDFLIKTSLQMKSFCVHTGNINNYVELTKKRFSNSAEELCACLNLQFSKLPEDTQIAENGTLLLADKNHREPLYDRDDLKITLKLFIKDFKIESVRNAIQSAMDELQIDSIEQLIIAFPLSPAASSSAPAPAPVTCQNGHCATTPPTSPLVHSLNEKWMEDVLRLWTSIDEEFVQTRKVFSVGVSDFHFEALRALYDASSLKPCVDHFNIDTCCVMPSNLQNFAREHDIQLLTHNDPIPFPLKDIFHSFCDCSKDEQGTRCSIFEPTWAARYTIWVRRRSLMAAKGYIVNFRSARCQQLGSEQKNE